MENLGQYSVIKFTESTDSGQPVVDFVPTSWLTKGTHGRYKTAYPPPPYVNIKIMVKNLSTPRLTWEDFPVTLLYTLGE